MPQMGIQPENRVRKDTGETSPVTGPSSIVQKGLLYLFFCTQRSMDNIKLCSVSSPDSYQNQAFSLHTQLYTQVLGDLHHLLARGPITILRPFSDKGLSTRRLVCLVLPKVWCHSHKALNKVNSYIAKAQQFTTSKRSTVIYNKEKQLTQKSSVANIKTTIFLFLYPNYID